MASAADMRKMSNRVPISFAAVDHFYTAIDEIASNSDRERTCKRGTAYDRLFRV